MANRMLYSVILTKGTNRDLRQYIWVDGSVLDKAIEFSRQGIPCDLVNDGRGFLMGRYVVAVSDDYLDLFARRESDANEFANHLGLPVPFLKSGDEYILNDNRDD